jgi:hypothetical protein
MKRESLLKLQRSPAEGWHHANRPRRVMSPSLWLRGSVAPWLCENQEKERIGVGDPGVPRWQSHSRPPGYRGLQVEGARSRDSIWAMQWAVPLESSCIWTQRNVPREVGAVVQPESGSRRGHTAHRSNVKFPTGVDASGHTLSGHSDSCGRQSDTGCRDVSVGSVSKSIRATEPGSRIPCDPGVERYDMQQVC